NLLKDIICIVCDVPYYYISGCRKDRYNKNQCPYCTVRNKGYNITRRRDLIGRQFHNLIVFFFSSRRRHTILQGDWSSDVCSSDLVSRENESPLHFFRPHPTLPGTGSDRPRSVGWGRKNARETRFRAKLRTGSGIAEVFRSEERRVGKECRTGGSVEQ